MQIYVTIHQRNIAFDPQQRVKAMLLSKLLKRLGIPVTVYEYEWRKPKYQRWKEVQ